MSTNVKLLGPTAHGKTLENQRISRELADARIENQLLRAELAARGVDVDALLAAAGMTTLPLPVAPAQAPIAPLPMAPRDMEEVPVGGRQAATVRPPVGPRRVVAGPMTRVPGLPAGAAPLTPPIPTPSGGSVQLLPNVTGMRSGAAPAAAQPAAAQPAATGPIATPSGGTIQMLPNVTRGAQPAAAPVAAAPVPQPSQSAGARQAPQTQIVEATSPVIEDDAQARFDLLELDLEPSDRKAGR